MIKQNQTKLEVGDHFEYRKRIYLEFVNMSFSQNEDFSFCSVCSKTESNKKLIVRFKCWHAYHINCLASKKDFCPQCEVLKFLV